MKPTNRKPSKVVLHRETLMVLKRRELADVAGRGAPQDGDGSSGDPSCPETGQFQTCELPNRA